MASVRVTHGIGDLANDCAHIARTARSDMARTVRRHAIEGNKIARRLASQQHTMSSNYDIHYPRSFSSESLTPLSWTYGPDASKPQGGMSFEYGSRNSPPHLDLNHSADIIGPQLANAVQDLPGRWFWPR